MGFNCLNCFIVLHLGASFTMEMYGLMLGFWYFLISSSRSEGTGKKIICLNVLRSGVYPTGMGLTPNKILVSFKLDLLRPVEYQYLH